MTAKSGSSNDGAERRNKLNRKLRTAFLKGAEEHSRRSLGRGLTAEKIDRVIRRYPGDVADEVEPLKPTEL
jgi:hypothetical protein